MLFANKVTTNKAAFLQKVIEIAADLNCDPDFLMWVMWYESKLNPQAVNSISGATGLIQFMPTTAIGLGTTTAALLQMSNLQQLEYVKKYYLPYKNRIKTFEDAYIITFFPAALGKPDSYVLKTNKLSAALIAKQNKPFDLNKDGQITAGELRQYMRNKWISAGANLPENNPPVINEPAKNPIKKKDNNLIFILAGIVIVAGIAVIISKTAKTKAVTA